MRKKARIVVALIMVVCSLFVIGCSKGDSAIEKNAENSYLISIYKEIYEQDADGIVKFTGYDLWKSFYVLKTQMFKLPEGKNEAFIYDSYSGEKKSTENDIYILPSSDKTLYVRERQKKTINIYYYGQKIYNTLSGENKELYDKTFVNTYAETFSISTLLRILGFSSGTTTISLYTKSTYLADGEPFCRSDDSYYRSFGLIKTTDVYVVKS